VADGRVGYIENHIARAFLMNNSSQLTALHARHGAVARGAGRMREAEGNQRELGTSGSSRTSYISGTQRVASRSKATTLGRSAGKGTNQGGCRHIRNHTKGAYLPFLKSKKYQILLNFGLNTSEPQIISVKTVERMQMPASVHKNSKF
jgi:hypothetical protein